MSDRYKSREIGYDEVMYQVFLYDPYLDSLGGGEKYLGTLAQLLLRHGCQVYWIWHNSDELLRLARKFNLRLTGIRQLPLSVWHQSLPARLAWQRQFDLGVVISDGSLPTMGAKRNLVHFQVPFRYVYGGSLSNWVKRQMIHDFVANSYFTKDFVDQEYGINSQVIYPPVEVSGLDVEEDKKNYILYVGRFSDLLQKKGQLMLVQIFKQLVDEGIDDYRLVLAGSNEVGSDRLLTKLKQEAVGYPIELVINPSYQMLMSWYQQAKFFWSAAGFGVNELTNPQLCEHFGISAVEAMAAGAVPLLVAKGGHRELIEHRISGFLWQEPEELISYTKLLMSRPQLFRQLSQAASQRARKFNRQRFDQQFIRLLHLPMLK